MIESSFSLSLLADPYREDVTSVSTILTISLPQYSECSYLSSEGCLSFALCFERIFPPFSGLEVVFRFLLQEDDVHRSVKGVCPIRERGDKGKRHEEALSPSSCPPYDSDDEGGFLPLFVAFSFPCLASNQLLLVEGGAPTFSLHSHVDILRAGVYIHPNHRTVIIAWISTNQHIICIFSRTSVHSVEKILSVFPC